MATAYWCILVAAILPYVWYTAARAGAVSALRLGAHGAAVAIRLDGVQGAMALPRLPRAVRSLQAALKRAP